MQNNGGCIYSLRLNDFLLIAAAVTDIYGLGSSRACMLECLVICLCSYKLQEAKLVKKKVIFPCHFLLLFVRVIKRLTSFSFKFDLLTGLVLRNKDDILGYHTQLWALLPSGNAKENRVIQAAAQQVHSTTVPNHC